MALPDISHLHCFKINPDAILPTKSFSQDAGFDLYCPTAINLHKGEDTLIDTGIAVKIPEGYVGQISPRSSMNLKRIHTRIGIVDASFAGSIKIILRNESDDFIQLDAGSRIAQLVIMPILNINSVFEVNELWTSDRGSNAFGSSGK